MNVKYAFFCVFLLSCIALNGYAIGDSDTIPPVITVVASDLDVECTPAYIDSLTQWYIAFGGLEATDSDGDVTYSATLSFIEARDSFELSIEGSCINTGLISVGFFALDECDNSSIDTSYASFTVSDNINPIITVEPQDIIVNCDQNIVTTMTSWIDDHGFAEATDECSEVSWNEYIWSDNQGNNGFGLIGDPIDIPILREDCNWFINVSFFAADECANRTATIGRLSLMDTIPPFFEVVPEDITVSCDAIPDFTTYPVIDYCEANIQFEPEEFSVQIEDRENCEHYNYLLERVYNVSDACGNTLTHTQVITVIDTTPPMAELMEIIDVPCTTPLDSLDAFITVVDNCDSPVTIQFIDQFIDDASCSGQFDRNYTVTDVCGNQSTYTQRVNLIDNVAPIITNDAINLVIACDTTVAYSILLDEWVGNLGGSQAIESCGDFTSFVAVSGSFSLLDESTFPGLPPTIPQDYCQVAEDGITYTQQYAVVYIDDCGNASQTVASLIIMDEEAPEIVECAESVEVALMGEDCIANASIPIPIADDNCLSVSGTQTVSQMESITSDDSGSSTALVDPIVFEFDEFNINQIGKEPAIFNLYFEAFDGDGPQEYFDIFIEGIPYGRSPQLDQECQDTTLTLEPIPADSLISWLDDGLILIELIPNSPPGNGSLGINDICDESSVEVTIQATLLSDDFIEISYSLDNGNVTSTQQIDSLDLTLEEGMHTVEFFFKDCGGNVSSCITNIIVVDNEPPQMTCPNDTILITEITSCCVEYQLSTEFVYADNCISSGRISETLPTDGGDIIFDYDEGTDSYSARDRQYLFTVPNASSKILENPQIRIDVAANTESDFVTILNENGQILAQFENTDVTSCGDRTSILIDIDEVDFAAWLVDDELLFTFVGNSLLPCGEPLAGIDGVSNLQLTLLYSDIQPDYSISGDTLITGRIDDLESPPIHTLCVGDYNITYSVQDATGNIGECTYSMTVNDLVAPIIGCKDTVIVLPIDGSLPYVFSPPDLLSSAFENCGDLIYNFDIREVDCNDIGSTIEVTSTVADESGNSNVCTSFVQILQQPLIPSFTIGICQGDELQLLANVPEGNNINALKFFWSGPNGYLSNQENPIIANPQSINSGIYNLTIEGLNGCTATSTIDVQFDQFEDPEIILQGNDFCIEDEITLTASNYSGNVNYLWYEGAAPNGILIAQTTVPIVQIQGTQGLHLYYVEVSNDFCVSNPSESLGVDVSLRPVAQVVNPFVTVCNGESIQFSAIESEILGVQYLWSGPNGYQGDGLSPISISSASEQNEGTYNLVVQNGGCLSEAATVQVVVFDRPQTPILSGDNLLCEGVPLTLTVLNEPNATSYAWYKDGLLFSNTTTNSLSINNSTTDLSGEWTCIISNDLCSSELSDPFIVSVETSLQVGVGNNGPVCVGDSIELISTLIVQASYTWESPSGALFNGQRPTVIAEAGQYTLTVVNNVGCEATETTTVVVNSAPIITALSNTSPDCGDDDVSIVFSPTIFPPGDYDYNWSGPNGWTSDELNPVIDNAADQDNGEYILVVIANGCASDPVSTEVNITIIPNQPVITTIENTCQGEILKVTATEVNNANAEYIWETPNGTVITDENQLLLSNIGLENSGFYSVSIQGDDCTSLISDGVNIVINSLPDNPQILVPPIACEGGDATLQVIQPQVGVEYLWTGPNGNQFTGVEWELTGLSSQDLGTYSAIAILNGCESELIAQSSLFVRTQPTQPPLEFIDTTLCLSQLEDFQFCFDPNTLFQYDSLVVFDLGLDSIVLTSDMPCSGLDLTYIQGIEAFYGVIGYSQTCESNLSEVVTITLEDDRESLANFAFDSLIICDETLVDINFEVSGDTDSISVSSSTTLVTIDLIDNSFVRVSDILSDDFEVYLQTWSANCGLVASDTIDIVKESEINIQSQIITLTAVGDYSIDLLTNATLPPEYQINIINTASDISAKLNGDILEVTTSLDFIGNTSIEVEVCSENCPEICDTATILLVVGDDSDCIASNVVTPNNDGFNDTFRIPCLSSDRYENNKLIIFNRWGDEVYSAQPYKSDWDATYKGSNLPSGTYFYILTLNIEREPIQGFIVVER